MSRRTRALARRVRKCEGSDGSRGSRHVAVLRKDLGSRRIRGGIHQYLCPPVLSPEGDDCILINILGLQELDEMTVPTGTTVGKIKAWLRKRNWQVSDVVSRNMLRLSDYSRVFSDDVLVFRLVTVRAGAPKGESLGRLQPLLRGQSLWLLFSWISRMSK